MYIIIKKVIFESVEKKVRYAVDIKRLNKTFINKRKKESILALINVSLQIPKGSLFGLLGLNT